MAESLVGDNMNRVLVTGGSGFFGYWLRQTQPDNIDGVYLSSNDYKELDWWLGTPYDYVIHCAPISPKKILELFPHKRILFTSSGAVYDRQTKYAHNKRKWEQECLDSGVNVVITRPFTFIGEHLNGDFAITNFIEQYKKGKPLKVYGDGSSVRSYLYGKDLGTWLWKILFEGDDIYDVGSIYLHTIVEVAKMISPNIKFVHPEHIEGVYLPVDVTPNWRLGLKETIGLKEAIQRCINA
mgnify:CR=1 FL=1